MADLKTCIIDTCRLVNKTLKNEIREKKCGEMTIVIYN